jgi:DNA repair photolyase
MKMLLKDMADLERFDVPPAPIHLSNSTDPFQPLEAEVGHTRATLEQVLTHRKRFSSVVILTKNPTLAAEPGYVDLFRQLGQIGRDHPSCSKFTRTGIPPFLMEVSLAFWREEARQAYDPGAPSIVERMEGIRLLRQAGIPVALRIDPLFPRAPFRNKSDRTYRDFDLPEPQALGDLERLVTFAQETGACRVVYSPAKIVQPRSRPMSRMMRSMRSLYEYIAAPERLISRGGSWRLPPQRQSAVTGALLDLCRKHGVPAKCCMQNLIETP